MYQLAIYAGQGLLSSPYVVFKTVSGYVIPWVMPSIRVSLDPIKKEPEKKEKEIELIGKSLFPESSDPEKEPAVKEPSTALIPYQPHIALHIPTLAEIGSRALTSIIIDLPIFVIKNLYKSPVPTMIALYAILPAPVWQMIFPRLLSYLKYAIA